VNRMDTPIESKSQDRELTTTSYGVLAILSLRDHSTYDLIRQMKRSLHYMWPRAESNVYAEPKRLVDAGLAKYREEWSGKRRRTVYSITPAGRASLAQWLRAPSPAARYESEALVKILFAENGTRDDLLATIRSIRASSSEVISHFRAIADEYSSGGGEYPERFGLSGLAARLLLDQHEATLRWADWAETVVLRWETPLSATAEWGVAAVREAAENT
jgi:PadR family transcriptional regulator AphA